MKNKFGFVLVKPQLGENIGAAARSLKNFGFSKLNLVTPKFMFPNQKNIKSLHKFSFYYAMLLTMVSLLFECSRNLKGTS